MDHIQFKSNQTAAAYVAHELTEQQQEQFELHMMGCSECLNDVEAWRVIKQHMPAPEVIEARKPFKKLWWGGWGMAASFVGAMLVAGAGGYLASVLQRPSLDSSETAIFNLPAVTRGADDCTTLALAANARAVVVRVPGVASDNRVIATDAAGRELSGAHYSAREQRDGSWALRFDADWLQQQPARLVSRGPGGDEEPLGCLNAAVAPPPG
ncbi:MAG TPA: zf-HC2 domain-containing protein [Steroidobacteraceae bacterium]|nr:zf-HC2 domain-containing protein [Steroidobacteraceae bacterium]